MKKQQFKSSVANSSRVNNPYRRLSLTRVSTPHSKYRCINIVAKLQRLSPKENPLALAAVHKKTWKMQGGGGTISNLRLDREFAFVHLHWNRVRGKVRQSRQKYWKINRHRQMERQTDRGAHAEEDLWERESWTLFACCFHPCLCSIMTQRWPSNDTVEETKETQIYACTATQHWLSTTSPHNFEMVFKAVMLEKKTEKK